MEFLLRNAKNKTLNTIDMAQNTYDPKAAYSLVKKIYFAILAGPILFLFIALVITEGASSSAFDIQEPLNLALIIITLISIPMGSIISRRAFSAVKPEDDTRKKMAAFQSGMIIRLATYEGVELFSIVVFILTGNILVLLFAAISFAGILMTYPRPSYIRQSVGVNEDELL